MTKRRTRLLLVLGFTAIGLAVNAGVLGVPFLSDDYDIVRILKDHGPRALWCFRPAPFLRPLTSLSFYVDYLLWHTNALGFHLTNVLLHSANALLVTLLVSALLGPLRLEPRSRLLHATTAGLLFLVLPTHTEAVTWVAGRADLLATFFYLLAICLYLAARQRSSRLLLGVALLSGGAGLLAKEPVVTLPIALALCEGFLLLAEPAARSWRRAAGRVALFVALIGAYIAARRALLGVLVGGYGTVHLRHDPVLLLLNLISFFRRTFAPPAIEALRNQTLVDGAIAACLGVTALALVLGRSPGRKERGLLLAALLASGAVALLPALNLGVSHATTEGERFIYLPSVFWVAALVVASGAVLPRLRYSVAVWAICAASCVYALELTNQSWIRAGGIARSLLQDGDRLSRSRNLFIMNLPADLRGAYVFRNGFRSAVRLLRAGGPGRDPVPLALQRLNSAEDACVATSSGYRVEITLREPRDALQPTSLWKRLNGRWYDIEVLERNRVVVEFKRSVIHSRSTVVYWSEGHLETALSW